MTKKHLILAVSAVVVLAALAGGSWYIKYRRGDDGSNLDAGAPVALNDKSRPDTIPLDQSSEGSSDANSLKVMPAQELGQTNIGQTATNSGGGQSSEGQLDPSKFGSYEKYKNEQNTLFGDIQKGDGLEAVVGKKVAVSYKGWLTSGELFDQSKGGSPFIFTIGEHRVIPGWEQGIVGMKVGGTRLLIVPPAVGYGAEGKSPIPPNAVLIFEVSLQAVQQ